MRERSTEKGTNWFCKMICEVRRRSELSHPRGWGLWVGSTDQNVSRWVLGLSQTQEWWPIRLLFPLLPSESESESCYWWELSDPSFACVHLELSMWIWDICGCGFCGCNLSHSDQSNVGNINVSKPLYYWYLQTKRRLRFPCSPGFLGM